MLSATPHGLLFRGPRIPGLLDSMELKRAMMTTLALRQNALVQASSRELARGILKQANAARPSSCKILSQAIAAEQIVADSNADALEQPAFPPVAKERQTSVKQKSGVSRREIKEPSCHPIVSPESTMKPVVTQESLGGTMKRRLSPSPSSQSKKPRPLSDLAHENTLQVHAGPCFPYSRGRNDDESQFYFL